MCSRVVVVALDRRARDVISQLPALLTLAFPCPRSYWYPSGISERSTKQPMLYWDIIYLLYSPSGISAPGLEHLNYEQPFFRFRYAMQQMPNPENVHARSRDDQSLYSALRIGILSPALFRCEIIPRYSMGTKFVSCPAQGTHSIAFIA